MHKSYGEFLQIKNREFSIIVSNLFIFLPYYFSVKHLLKTLFQPWKNLRDVKTKPGFSLHDWWSRFMFNAISSGIGFAMRVGVLMMFLYAQIILVLLIPFIYFFYLFTLPFGYLQYKSKKSPEELKHELAKSFLSRRLLKPENLSAAAQWFEFFYQSQVKKTPWWELSNLLSGPPLGRDWSVGYTPTLDKFGKELTVPKKHFIHLFNRQKEIQQIEQVLAKSGESNIIIVGEDGVGKHTIIEELAKKIYEGKINPILAFKRIIRIDMDQIMSQTTDLTQKMEIVKAILREAQDAGNIILLIEDFHKYTSSESGHTDLSAPIADFARSPKLQFIGITTPFFYQKSINNNEKIKQLFERIDVFEISKADALKVLLESTFQFERRFKLIIPYEAAVEAIEKSDFYITDIPFPEKAIDLLDEACVYTNQIKKKLIVLPEYIDETLSAKTHIPVTLDETMKNKLLELEPLLMEYIVHQDQAIQKLAATLRKSFVIAHSRKKPLASFLFLGPTGVGKTETAKAIAQVFFGSDRKLLRFDMSFYQSKADIQNLLGNAESGSVGLLTQSIRENPYGVLLIDEIEKADPDLLNIFLTLLDEAYITDGFGKHVDCKNLIVVATSNAGADIIYKKDSESQTEAVNLTVKEKEIKLQKDLINSLIEHHIFAAEFINRFDGVIVYNSLGKEAIRSVAGKLIKKIADDVYKTHKVRIEVDDNFIAELVEKGYDPQFGARNMDRLIRDHVEDIIAKKILENKVQAGQVISF